MEVTLEEIELYLNEMKIAVKNDRYRIDRNTKRKGNNDLFIDYIIDETKAKKILLSLDVNDFSEKRNNEHKDMNMRFCIYLERMLNCWNVLVQKRRSFRYISSLTN